MSERYTFTTDAALTVKSSSSATAEWVEIEGVASTGALDAHMDRVAPGAFGNPDPAQVKMLFAHDTAQPLGVWRSIEQVGSQLRVRGALLQSLAKAREVTAMLRHGVINSLSVAFRADPDGITRDQKGRRVITAARL